MIGDIQKLLDKGLAYPAGGNVYFDVCAFPSYYALFGNEPPQEDAIARVAFDSHKRHARDFALWFTKSKFKDQAMQWDSPWGKGYMGWHIECSAMAREFLGEPDRYPLWGCRSHSHSPHERTRPSARYQRDSMGQFLAPWGISRYGKGKKCLNLWGIF